MNLKGEQLMSNSFYHKDLTDAQWNRIKFVFEEPAKVGRPSLNPRRVFNAIMWILKSGARWRDLPARYGTTNWLCALEFPFTRCFHYSLLIYQQPEESGVAD